MLPSYIACMPFVVALLLYALACILYRLTSAHLAAFWSRRHPWHVTAQSSIEAVSALLLSCSAHLSDDGRNDASAPKNLLRPDNTASGSCSSCMPSELQKVTAQRLRHGMQPQRKRLKKALACLCSVPAYGERPGTPTSDEDLCMQLQQLPEAVRADLSGRASEEARKQAMANYSQRFVTARLDASCLTAASSGQSSTVNDALTGGDLFQVSSLHIRLSLTCVGDGVLYTRRHFPYDMADVLDATAICFGRSNCSVADPRLTDVF